MRDYSKKTNKRLKELAGLAYERLLTKLTEDLHNQFKQWHSGEINVWDLNQRIHEYHDNDAKDLWQKFNQGDVDLQVFYGYKNGVLSNDEIPDEVLTDILDRLKHFSS